MNLLTLKTKNLIVLSFAGLLAGCGAFNGAASVSESKPAVVIVDTTAPTAIANLVDGAFIVGTSAIPIATWNHATDESAITYQIAIGTTVGATDTVDWTSKTGLNTATHTGLSLVAGALYYTSVRAIDAAGNIGPATSGDGWRAVEPIVIAPASKMLVTNERFPFSATGGFGSLTLSKSSGPGTLTGSLFQAPLSPGASVLKFQDSLSIEASANITIRGFEHLLATTRDGWPMIELQDAAYDASGNLYAVGAYHTGSSNWLVVKFDGTTWTVLEDTRFGSTQGGASASSILVNSPSDIYVAGYRSAGWLMKWTVRHFDGSTWTTIDEFALTAGNHSLASDVVRGNDGSVFVVGLAYDASSIGRWIVRRYLSGVWSTSDDYRRGGTANRNYANAAAVAPDGTVYVCGEANVGTVVGGEWVIRKFSGGSWSEAEVYGGASATESCATVAVDSSNNVYAAGVGSTASNEVRKWNGTAWSTLGSLPLPSGYLDMSAADIEIDTAGRPVVIYSGYLGDGETQLVIGRYEPTPTLLHTFGTGASGEIVRQSSGDLVFGGLQSTSIGAPSWHLRKLEGASLNLLSEYRVTKPTNLIVNDSAYDSQGNLYVVGSLETHPGTGRRVWLVRKFDGTTWTDVDTFSLDQMGGYIDARGILIDSSDNIFVVGEGYDVDNVLHWIVRKFDGTSWATVDDYHPASEPEHGANAILSHGGSIYVAGWSMDANYQLKIMIRKFDGTSWSTFQTFDVETSADYGDQMELLIDSANNFWVSAAYVADGYSSTYLRVMKFDGTTWTTSALSTDNQTIIRMSLAQSPTGEIYHSYTTFNAGSHSGIVKRFNGTSWVDFDVLVGSTTMHTAMKADPEGNLYFGGLSSSGLFIKKWNGHYLDEVYSAPINSEYPLTSVGAFGFGSSGQMAFLTMSDVASGGHNTTALYRLAP